MRPPVPREVEDEIAFHIEMTIRELVAGGMTHENAQAEAVRRFGDTGMVNAECQELGHDRDRGARRAELHIELQQDLRFAARQLARARGFTSVAVLTLALGIGATTTVFSALYAVVLRPLPFEHPDRIVAVTPSAKGEPGSPSAAEFVAQRDHVVAFEHVAATVLQTGFTITDGDLPDLVAGGRVSAAYFDVFAAKPEIGRVFTRDEDTPGREHLVVLSHHAWTTRYNGDRSVLGRTIHMNGEAYVVVGVMPKSFEISQDGEELWVPIALTSQQLSETGARYLRIVARLKPGVSLEQARSAATTAERVQVAALPERRTPVSESGIIITRFADDMVGGYQKLLFVLLGAVSFVLLIACTNVANLLLARGSARAKELAIRAAIGAGRGRLIRQMLTESALLATVGAVLGVAIAFILLRVLVRVSPANVPRLDQAHIDWHVLVFALAMAGVSSLVFGLLPALRAAGSQLQGTLREGGRDSSVGGGGRLRGILVGFEVAMAMTLLTGAGLLLRSAWLLQRVQPGFEPRGVMTARILLPAARYSDGASIVRAYAAMQREAAGIPGVSSAALVSVVPLSGSQMSVSVFSDRQSGERDAPTGANVRFASHDYFKTMRIPLRVGRDIASSDDAIASPVVVLNETLARKLWPRLTLNAIIGRRINALSPKRSEPHWMTVVGIVGDIHDGSLGSSVAAEFYSPVAQTPAIIWPLIQRSLVVVVRARSEASPVETLVKPLGRAVATVDPSLPLADARSMTSYLRGSLETARFNTLLLSTLGVIALLLAVIGVYGVVAYFVAQRTHEVGVRMALGATPLAIWRLVVRWGFTPAAIGVAAGVGLSLTTGGVLREQLYGITSTDPATLGAVGLLLLAASMMATYVPARRAMRVSPMEAIRRG